MKARIGVADSTKVIEIEVDDAVAFRDEVETVMKSDETVAWFTDVKQRTVGVPTARIAYVEIDAEDGARSIGFAPGT
ncbi:MAG TPA: DUF3107 family protein [Acidimicrobiia bacterium]|nr:DUF3107 family protein [Acidimicrobiia bacterium]